MACEVNIWKQLPWKNATTYAIMQPSELLVASERGWNNGTGSEHFFKNVWSLYRFLLCILRLLACGSLEYKIKTCEKVK